MELVVHPVRLMHAPPFCEQYILISQGFQKRRTPLFDKIVRKAEFVHMCDRYTIMCLTYPTSWFNSCCVLTEKIGASSFFHIPIAIAPLISLFFFGNSFFIVTLHNGSKQTVRLCIYPLCSGGLKTVPKSTLICALTPNPCKEYHHRWKLARIACSEEYP